MRAQTEQFMREWLGRFQVEEPGDIWEQAEFNQILKGAHATMPDLRWEPMDEAWFVDLCAATAAAPPPPPLPARTAICLL